MNELWLKKGILVFSKEDIFEVLHENNSIKATLKKKLKLSTFLVVFLSSIVGFLTNELMTPKVGDIGVFDPNGETTILDPTINPKLTKRMVYNFATKVAIHVRTFFFATFADDLFNTEVYFTPDAWLQYLQYIEKNKTYLKVANESINVTAAESPKNQINSANFIDNYTSYHYVRVRLILRVENRSGIDEFLNEDLLFTLEEVDRGKSKHGLLISALEVL